MVTPLNDTDVLIHALRGVEEAAINLRDQGRPRIAEVTRMELILGVRDGRQLRTLSGFLERMRVEVVPLSGAVGRRASSLLERHALADGLDLGDAMIAATALEEGSDLQTGNLKHFRKLAGLNLLPFQPG